ncbi:reverse transcriptase domain-containing protein [Tanacetum coccineum]
MYTRGRKKVDAEPAPPARDPRDVETIERLQQRIQELEPQQHGRTRRYVNRRYQPRRKVHPDEFIDWLSTIEPVFDVRDIPDKLKVKLVAIKLRQHASLWWDHVTKRRRIEGKSKVINEFDKLHMRCDVVEEEEQVVVRFLGVLKPEIANIVTLQPYWTYTDVSPKTVPKTTTPTTSAAGNTRECVDNAPRCYKCGGLGNYARDCPNLKTLAFVPDDIGQIYDTDAEPELD